MKMYNVYIFNMIQNCWEYKCTIKSDNICEAVNKGQNIFPFEEVRVELVILKDLD